MLAVMMAGLVAAACADGGSAAPGEAGGGALPARDVGTDGVTDDQVVGDLLSIEDATYSPMDLLVGAGRVLTIVNHDDHEHTVTAWDGSFTVVVGAGERVELTAPDPGAYPYVCEIHDRMRGDLETM